MSRSDEAISAYGKARSTVTGTPLGTPNCAISTCRLACKPLSLPGDATPKPDEPEPKRL